MSNSNKFFIGLIIFLSMCFVIGTIWSYHLDNLIHTDYFENSSNYIFHTDKLGQFGDFIGGVLGTLLTVVATAYIYKTYISQKEQVSNQQFESTFFNLLITHRELKNSLKLDKRLSSIFLPIDHLQEMSQHLGIPVNQEASKFILDHELRDITLVGVNVIEFIAYDYRNLYEIENITKKINFLNTNSYITAHNSTVIEKLQKLKNELEQINKVYHDKYPDQLIFMDDFQYDLKLEEERLNLTYNFLFDDYQNQISHYCRNIYHILKFIRENEIRDNGGKKSMLKFRQYADLFQSQLSVSEQILLFYNFINFKDDEKGIYSTIELVNHYSFLENIGIENLVMRIHEEFYNFQIKGSDKKYR